MEIEYNPMPMPDTLVELQVCAYFEKPYTVLQEPVPWKEITS